MQLTRAIARRTLLLALSLLFVPAGIGAAQSLPGCAAADCTLALNQLPSTTAKIDQLKQEFVAALRQFVVTLAVFGGERSVRSNIESMSQALVRWDEAIRAFETALARS
jgi:hypothetical protein